MERSRAPSGFVLCMPGVAYLTWECKFPAGAIGRGLLFSFFTRGIRSRHRRWVSVGSVHSL